jgi:hypothetical protein
MLHEFLHIFGICADHDAHFNLLSIIGDSSIMNNISLSTKQIITYVKTKFR